MAQKGLNGFDGLTDLADPSSVGERNATKYAAGLIRRRWALAPGCRGFSGLAEFSCWCRKPSHVTRMLCNVRTLLGFNASKVPGCASVHRIWGSAKMARSFWCRRRVMRLAAVVWRRTSESKVAAAWHVCGWPGSRNYRCAQNFGKDVQ